MNVPVARIFPPNPQPGQRWGGWTWSGSRWVCTRLQGVFTNVQVFSASGPYTPTPGLMSATVESVGGGAAGGGVQTASATIALSGGGGGAGGYSRVTLAAELVLGGVNVIVGAAGQRSGVGLVGGNGGQTSFGAFCVANGGLGGMANGLSSAVGYGNGGLGGSLAGAIGDIVSAGNPGLPGTILVSNLGTEIPIPGGSGAAGPWGGGGFTVFVGAGQFEPGGDGMGPGAGGGGGAVNNVTGAETGGFGFSGACIVTETCWADTGDDGDCGCGPTGSARVSSAWPCPPGGWDD